jgi:hypothetical protein
VLRAILCERAFADLDRRDGGAVEQNGVAATRFE